MNGKFIDLEIRIDPSPRKSTSRQISMNRKTGARFVRKSDKALKFVADFIRSVGIRPSTEITGPFRLEAHIYYPSRRPDLSTELIQDCLEKCNIIENDRLMVENFSRKYIDTENPRIVLRVSSVDWEYLPDKKRSRTT